MIKSTELQIGDWVIVYEKSMPVKAKVEGVYGKMATVLGQQRIVEKSFVEPIPLTSEILEKNGWFYPPQSIWMKLDTPYRELWGCEHTDGTLWLYSSAELDKHDAFAEIRYVHELQHVLRLCGITLNIEV